MESLLLDSTAKTPQVQFNGDSGLIEIKGRSIPENSIEFYKPLVDWLETYVTKGNSPLKVNIQLEYFNTSSSKCILDVFKRLEAIHKSGKEVNISWYYEEDDEDMLEAGEDYESIIRVPFKMIEIVD